MPGPGTYDELPTDVAGQPLAQSEAQADSRRRLGRLLVRLGEWTKQLARLLRGDPGTVIGDADLGDAVADRPLDVNPAVGRGRRVLAGIVHQVEENLLHGGGIGPHELLGIGRRRGLLQRHARLAGPAGADAPCCAASAAPVRSPPRAAVPRPRSSRAYCSTLSTRCDSRSASTRNVSRYERRCWSSRTIPSASISAYMRNVVSGDRNSCVTADTKAARRSLNANTLRSMMALATQPAAGSTRRSPAKCEWPTRWPKRSARLPPTRPGRWPAATAGRATWPACVREQPSSDPSPARGRSTGNRSATSCCSRTS